MEIDNKKTDGRIGMVGKKTNQYLWTHKHAHADMKYCIEHTILLLAILIRLFFWWRVVAWLQPKEENKIHSDWWICYSPNKLRKNESIFEIKIESEQQKQLNNDCTRKMCVFVCEWAK